MSHSFTRSLYHAVFRTKDRLPTIDPVLQVRLYPYLQAIARTKGFDAIAVSGVEDHVHLLLDLPSSMAIAKAIQLLKGNSSHWIHGILTDYECFEWQVGYSAFSLGVSQIQRTITYIQHQPEHHRHETYQEEFIRFLGAHGIQYDATIWD